jgi:fluoride ion exporter CrcB/FEX
MLSPGANLFLAVGILGGSTTSSFGYEAMHLLSSGAAGASPLNVPWAFTASTGAVSLGFVLARIVQA